MGVWSVVAVVVVWHLLAFIERELELSHHRMGAKKGARVYV